MGRPIMCPEIFWKKVDKNGPIPKSCPERGPCWLWTGCTNKAGYGVTSVAGEFRKAHRLAYEYELGAIPDGLMVCHHCDVPRCCRSSHFFLGTRKDNAADRDRKGRQSKGVKHSLAIAMVASGEHSARHVLTEAQVLEIRALYKRGVYGRGSDVLGRRFGVYGTTILQIVNRETWKHI